MRLRLLRPNEVIQTIVRIFFREPHRREFQSHFALEAGKGHVVTDMICRVAGQVSGGWFDGEVEALGCVWTVKAGRLADVRQVQADEKRE